ncbi:MAG: DUF5668 domain-containing protein [Chloroflexota bacterium]
MFIGLVLVAVGVIAILVQTGILTGSVWSYTWPIILIILGLLFITRRFGRRQRWYRWWYPPGSEDEKKDRTG